MILNLDMSNMYKCDTKMNDEVNIKGRETAMNKARQ